MDKYIIHHISLSSHRVHKQYREVVGVVYASSIQDAYKGCCNEGFSWNTIKHCRSTTTGDVIQHNNTFYLLTSQGFRIVTEA